MTRSICHFPRDQDMNLVYKERGFSLLHTLSKRRQSKPGVLRLVKSSFIVLLNYVKYTLYVKVCFLHLLLNIESESAPLQVIYSMTRKQMVASIVDKVDSL